MMNLSDPSADDDSSSDESPKASIPAKRPRSDTYGASSTTSHGSVLLESDEEQPETPVERSNNFNFRKQSTDGNLRLSRSSSSPTDQFDDIRPSFDGNDTDNGESSMRPSFQNSTSYTQFKEMESAFAGGYSEKSKRIMSNMGFKLGKGLGKYEHGRIEPVEASTQKGRRGLGLKPSTVGEVPRDFTWSPDESKPEAKEEVLWMPPPPDDTLSGDQLDEWLVRGPKKLTIDDETEFVDPQILKGVLESKTIFDTLDDEDLRHARFRSNPYETIASVIFLNRAAVKMANIDAVFDFMFTKPKKQNGESGIDKKEILYFADVCAGPGGFSEYVLYRKGWRSKGFGFTLKGPNDFKLSDFYAGTPETFNPYYGVKDDGNVFDPANLISLKENVLKHTDDKGVHFLMADGGFSVEGQENIQEILSKQLYLCQCLAALMLVRTGGHFVVKLFDVFTMFSVGLIYIMYKCFEKVSIHKPVTSRPANSERYLVCMWKKLGTESAEQHLFSVNSTLFKGSADGQDITELVPLHIIQEDQGFYEYIYKSNCLLGERQIKNLLKIAAFSKDKNLKDETQAEMREQCLKLWQLPDKVRTQPDRMSHDDTLLSILSLLKKPPPDSQSASAFKNNILSEPPEYLRNPRDLETFKSVYDWHFMILGSGMNSPDLRFFLGCGGKQVYQLEGIRWKNVVDLHVTLPAKTLLYGEVVKEFRGEGSKQVYSKALHVIDAMVLGGIDISHLPLTERINQCALFCTALEKPFDAQALPIRSKRLFNMECFSMAINNLEYRAMKRVKRAVTIKTPNRNQDDMFYVVGSLLFIKEIKVPYCVLSCIEPKFKINK
ncbi:cap-specific mRNA (nucleoside-2'-O-)-methyltransferase 1 isoform X2 [Pectinophora gossypiella]|uniref:cap-specific mRNA (nucleoside-2'-O-)-methyltransferase 1 isoform X2 n=1 Tax=Pectinophora gossypiella TaxID=13191 RepID=UPI00214EEB95|nr:cap-specific mRNA (nucleoside-2'-O-)-methyltransferase 1 isoform X2 [Pectinophora gossypiella]